MSEIEKIKQSILDLCNQRIALSYDRLRFEIERRRDLEKMPAEIAVQAWSDVQKALEVTNG